MRFTFVLNFFKALFEHLIFEHAIKLLSVKLSLKIRTSLVMLLFNDNANKKTFYLLFDF